MSSVLTDDFRDFIDLLIKHEVKFLICGGHAVGFHGYPRLTMDFDLLFEPSEQNAQKIIDVLNEFGFGNAGITKTVFLQEGTAVTLGEQPNQIDLLTSVSKIATHEIFKNAVNGKLEEFDVLYISKEDLIKCKKAAGRKKDLADVEELEKIN
jgi:predicted nucleotidyltransferase